MPVGKVVATAAAICCAVLAACHATPGLTLRCDGHCLLYPANLRDAPRPGERPDFPAR